MNPRSLCVLATLAAAAAGLLAPPPARAGKICAFALPSEMVDKVYSGTARAGEPFRFRITADTVLDTGMKVPAGTMGYGVIRAASAASRHNHDGMLALEPRYLDVANGKGGTSRVPVTMNPTLPVIWSPSEPLLNKAASHVPLPVPGLIMTGVNTVRWGRNITLGPGFSFTVLPIENLAHGPIC
ncbi:MAG: hypothetical protein JO036_17695 [Candidatus Eremiobacteraeota bacterium]|nr:hypothetical protein [Candidatus Eremiobacteraeota bacterium]